VPRIVEWPRRTTPYPPDALDRVLATLKEGSGIHFDPAMLDAFLGILPTILDIQTQWDSRAQTPNGIARIS